jgi:hypothetical protein
MRRRIALAGVLLVAAGLATAACGDDEAAPARTAAPATPVVSSSPVPAAVGAFQKFSGLTVPPEAQDVVVTTADNPVGGPGPLYRVTFTLPSAQANSFCAAGQMGGLTGANLVGKPLRREFGYDGPDQGTAVCSAGLPSNFDVQRRVLFTGTDQPRAQVQVLAYQVASR